MSALASDIEDERRPLPSSQTSLPYRPTSNSYGFSSSQYTPTTNNPSWMSQQYDQYHEKQQRYPQPFSKIFIYSEKQNQNWILDGSSPRQMWNGHQQYVSQNPTRLDFSNQTQQQQRLPPRPSTQYSQAINNPVPTNNCKTK